MGRMHPRYCEHDKMVDGGSFYEPEEIEGCATCEMEAVTNRLWLESRTDIETELTALRQLADYIVKHEFDGKPEVWLHIVERAKELRS